MVTNIERIKTFCLGLGLAFDYGKVSKHRTSYHFSDPITKEKIKIISNED